MIVLELVMVSVLLFPFFSYINQVMIKLYNVYNKHGICAYQAFPGLSSYSLGVEHT